MTLSQSDYDWKARTKAEMVRRSRHKADSAVYMGIPIVDMSRDELLAALAEMGEKWLDAHGIAREIRP